nr:unnamed protein product [Spirometra erinaceieuropaei]
MGDPIWGFIAEVVLQRLESLVFQHDRPKVWARYVDDIFVAIDQDELLTFKERLKAVFPDIQFTMKEEENNQLAFLDVLVVGFSDGYADESIGGLVVDLQDRVEREHINAEMDANIVSYGDSGLLFTHFKSEDGWMVLNISCNKSELVFEQKKVPQQVTCNLTYELTVPIALSFEIDYPPVAQLAPAFWLHLQTTSPEQLTIPLNLTILGARMGVAYLRIWARKAIEQSGSGLYVWHNWTRSDPLLVEAYLSTLVNRSEFGNGASVMGLPVKVLRPRGPIEIAFGIAMVVPIKPEFGFGLLTTGCCPGGGGSNVWTLLLHGDLNLSMTMTFISSIAALGMTPLALFAYGRFFLDVQQIKIPYVQIAGQLLYVVIPVIAGMLIKRYLPKTAAHIRRCLQPLSFIFIAVLVGFGTYVNLPIYALIGPYPLLLPTAAALPWIGFLAAGLIACLLRRSRAEILTIAIETGIQNIGIAILVLIYSMPQPEGDIGAVMPLVVALFTPLPLMIAAIVVCIQDGRCVCCKKRLQHTQLTQTTEDEDRVGGPKVKEVSEQHKMTALRS